MKRKLSVAILIPAASPSIALSEFIEWSLQQSFLNIVAIITIERPPTKPQPWKDFLIRTMDLSYVKQTLWYKSLKEAPHVAAQSLMPPIPSPLQVDYLLALGTEPPADLQKVATQGTIYIPALTEYYFGFAEVMRQLPTTNWQIQFTGGTGATQNLLNAKLLTQDSFLLNRAFGIARILNYLQLILASLGDEGASKLAHLRSQELQTPTCPPTWMDLSQYFYRRLKRTFIKKLSQIQNLQPQWNIGVLTSHWQQSDFSQDRSQAQYLELQQNQFFADPFIVNQKDRQVCFVEEYDFQAERGFISAIEVTSAGLQYLGPVLRENFHLSFPYIFEFQGQLYMCPESSQKKEIRLYKCEEFPLKWTYFKTLVANTTAVDTMIFEHEQIWWMLSNQTSDSSQDHCSELHLYWADSPLSNQWQAHPQNPLMIDATKARNGGLLHDSNGLYRVAQVQGFGVYGKSVQIQKIDLLNKQEYRETESLNLSATFLPKLIGTHHVHGNSNHTVFDFCRLQKVSRSCKKILILDGDLGSSLAIVRSLGRAGYHCEVAAANSHSISKTSKYTKRFFTYPNPLENETEFNQWVECHLMQYHYDAVIPVSERTLVPLMKIRSRITSTQIIMAENSSLEFALDKNKTAQLAQMLNVPMAQSLPLTSKVQLAEVLTHPMIQASFAQKLPIVIKPARSIAQGQLNAKKLEVKYAFNSQELLTFGALLLEHGEIILQQFFAGDGVGVELLLKDGKIEYSFQHLRLHELPFTGGASCLRQSVPIQPQLLEVAQKLMASLKWTGVAMVEFKWNPLTQKFILVEINGRFWGSLPLAIAAGADFPRMLVEQSLYGNVTTKQPYKVDVYCRQLKQDLRWYEMSLRKQTPKGFKGRWQNNSWLLRDALLCFSPNHKFDIQQLRDPLPGLIDFIDILNGYKLRVLELYHSKKKRHQHLKLWQVEAVLNRLQSAQTILFVCYGNINRSALAEAYALKSGLGQTKQIISAGFHPQDGRPADPNMVIEAKALDVELSNWQSRQLNLQMAEQADLIFAMEFEHLTKLQEKFPKLKNKSFLLGAADPHFIPSVEIADPYGKSRFHYNQCLQQVTKAIDALAAAVKKAQ